MKIEEPFLKEFDVYWKKVDWVKTCTCFGQIVCIKCLMSENNRCVVCGGNFHELFPKEKI
ncbi:hypothetical protein AC477_00320 [miscellaneous Crenarchaeota group-1 archaeon SG8-32-1]|uniref:Uncharacterized protein n=1 Tax=miscellaneous Crenarchaeota group-1 archaeon SG8-32-1 TaxID=1685124 RepID=A0A0M0C1L3_9ARCH|nr:MAG: hypothetical protein AC477_00320 [miscellaneous Crenarchaeota group-1 archaeon SG8-32-1]